MTVLRKKLLVERRSNIFCKYEFDLKIGLSKTCIYGMCWYVYLKLAGLYA